MKTVKTLEEFSKEINARNLFGQWQADEFLQRAQDGPQPNRIRFIIDDAGTRGLSCGGA